MNSCFILVYIPPRLLRDRGKNLKFFSNIIFFKFNFRLGLIFKVFYIPSFNPTVCVKLNFRWGLFSKRFKNEFWPTFSPFRFHFLACIIGMSTTISSQCLICAIDFYIPGLGLILLNSTKKFIISESQMLNNFTERFWKSINFELSI